MDISLKLIGAALNGVLGVFVELPFSLFHHTGVAITMYRYMVGLANG